MTREELIKECLKADLQEDSLPALIATAYFMGREAAAKTVCDKHNKIIWDQRRKAEKSSFRHVASEIIGSSDETFIKISDYSGNKTKAYGPLETGIELEVKKKVEEIV